MKGAYVPAAPWFSKGKKDGACIQLERDVRARGAWGDRGDALFREYVARERLDGGMPLSQLQSTHGIPLSAIRRWVTAFERGGRAALEANAAEVLEEQFAAAEATDDEAVHFAFKERLLRSHADEALARHFDFVRRAKNAELRQRLARFFSWHGEAAAPFLETVIARVDETPRERATALHMLGLLGERHRNLKDRIVKIVRARLDDESELVEERAVMLLGWLGTAKDMPALAGRLGEDRAAPVRTMAATQLAMLAGKSAAARKRAAAALSRAMRDDAKMPAVVRDACVGALARLAR